MHDTPSTEANGTASGAAAVLAAGSLEEMFLSSLDESVDHCRRSDRRADVNFEQAGRV